MIETKDKTGKLEVEDRIKDLEARLDDLLSGNVELEVKEVAVAPRSKLRVMCE